jgi:regulatory protein YycH of two-component signal transduction system YycFG
MSLFLPYVLYKVWCLSKSYAHTNNCKKKKQLIGKKIKRKKTEKKNTTAQIRD